MVKIGKYEYKLSTNKNKKLMVKVNNKIIHFGQKGYEHFFDKTELLDKKLNHGDKERRKRYLLRAKNIKDKSGKLTANNPESPNYHSIRILW
jgi:hypothetical protein